MADVWKPLSYDLVSGADRTAYSRK